MFENFGWFVCLKFYNYTYTKKAFKKHSNNLQLQEHSLPEDINFPLVEEFRRKTRSMSEYSLFLSEKLSEQLWSFFSVVGDSIVSWELLTHLDASSWL